MDEKPNWKRSLWKWLIAIPVVAVGLLVFAHGFNLEMRNPRSNEEDDFAWQVLGVGVSLIAAGASIPFCRPAIVILIALASPFLAFFFAVVAFWSFVIVNAIFRS